MSQNENFRITLKDFDSNIKSAWKEFHNDKYFTDVTLACDDKQIEAHRLVLSTFSPVLGNILTMNSNKTPLIYLKGVKYSDLVNLIRFMYQGDVDILQEELERFLNVAEDLKIKGLSKEKEIPFVNGNEELQVKGTPKDYGNTFEENSEKLINDSPIHFNDIDDNCKKRQSEHEIIYEHDDKQNPEVVKEYKLEEPREYDNYYANENEDLYPNSTVDNIETEMTTSNIETENNKSDSNSCVICGKCYSNSPNLRTHIESKHKGIRYTCEKCDYSATTTGNLKKHVMSKHEGIKFTCSQCGYKASQKQTLKSHMNKHHDL